MEVGEREELVRGRHREPKTGDSPSFYMYEKNLKEILLHPSGYRRRNGFGWAESCASAEAFAGGINSGLVKHRMSFPIQCSPIGPWSIANLGNGLRTARRTVLLVSKKGERDYYRMAR